MNHLHLGYEVADVQGAIDRAATLGIGVDWLLPSDFGPLAVYLDAAETLGVHLELVAPSMRRVVDSLLEKAHPA